MSITQHFADQVQAGLVGKPFVVERFDEGFVVGYPLADARWWSVLQYNNVRDSITYTVRVNEAKGSFSINDTLKRLSWSTGAGGMIPRVGFSFSMQSGRVRYGRVLQLGVAPGGFEVSFSPEAERARIKEIGQSLGLRPRIGGSALIGLWVAGGIIALCAVGAGTALLITALVS